MNVKNSFRYLLVCLLTISQVSLAAGPVIWNGTRSKALTSSGFVLSDGSTVDNDGQLNYIKNGTGEINVTGWTAYADAAGVVPVDCTGGAPTETVTRTTSTPLVGAGSILLTKDAANRQGEGIAYAFTIDEAFKSQSMMISFQGASGGTYSSSDLGVYIYDVTGAAIITPSTATIASGANNFQVTWTATANTSYRLCLHTKTTSASAYTYKLDKVFVGPYITAVAKLSEVTIANTSADYAGNTKYGFMQYAHGTNYNGGNAPTVTSGQSGFAVTYAYFIPYQMADATWRCRYNIVATFTSAALGAVAISMAVNGLTGKTGSAGQAVTTWMKNGNSATMYSQLNSGSDTIETYVTGGGSENGIRSSGDVALDSKPSWAY